MPERRHDFDGAAETPAPGVFTDPAGVAAVLWRGRRLFAACVLGCLGLAGVYLIQARRLYQATAKILVLDKGGTPLSAAGAEAVRLVRGAEDDIPTHAMLVSSPVVVRRAVETLGLNNLPSIDRTGGIDAAVRQVTENLSVSRPDRQVKILQIAYRTRSAAEAVRVVTAVAASYKSFLEEVYAEGNGEVVVLMSKARDDLNREMKDLERKYLEFRQQAPNLTGDGAGRPVINQRLDDWGRAAREAMVRGVQLKAQLELGRELAGKGVGLWSIAYALDQVGGGEGGRLGPRTLGLGPAPPSDYLRMLSTEQQQFAERFGAQSTKVKEIQEKLAEAQAGSREVRGRLEGAEVRDLLGSIDTTLKSIESMRGEIQRRFDQDMVLAKRAEIDQLTEQNLKNELARQRALFDSVVEQFKRASLVGDFAGIRSQVIEPPNALPKPVRPLVSMVLGMALAAGCVLGLGAALGAELVDPKVRSAGEVRRLWRLPVLGQLPYVPASQAPRHAPVGLICQTMPRSPSAESYRVIRANLDLSRRDRDVRVVMVTGPLGGEGKSTVAVNLAVSLAQAGRRVLLIDADLRTPTLHKTFGLARGRGLVHLLRGLLPPDRVVQATSVKNLDVVASGPEAPNPAELLSAPGLVEALARFREGYETVIIDAPALLPVADPSIVGAAADAIVLVLRVPATRRADAARAVEAVRGIGTPVLGVVLNGSAPDAVPWPWPPSAAAGETSASAGDPASSEIPHDPRMSFTRGDEAAGPVYHEPGLDAVRALSVSPTEAGHR